jgi:glutaredoxin 3
VSEVVVYTTPTCGYCHQAKQYLSQRGVPFTEYDVAADPRAADEMIGLSGQRGVPVIVVDGQVVVGFDRPRLDQLLASRRTAPPRLGLSVADASSMAQKRGSVPPEGAYVGGVKPLSLGDQAGVKNGDVIIELAGRPIGNADDLEAAASALSSGQKFDLVLLRDGQRISAQVKA